MVLVKTGATWWPRSMIICAIMAHFLTFENAADMFFFIGVPHALNLWVWRNQARDQLLELPCDQMSRIFTAHQPILFKQCIPNSTHIYSLGYFPAEQQNLFPLCTEKRLRHFTFFGADNRTKAIIEDVPCAKTTLAEKISAFNAHDMASNKSYFEVHTRMATKREARLLDHALHNEMLLPQEITTSRMVVPTVTHFFHAGRTAVYYLHSHLDRFLSFGLQEEKLWTLISPRYYDRFESSWSGNAQMMLREKTRAPRIEVLQRKGDVLFVPPWWIHETKVRPGKKNVGINIHWLTQGQILGYATSLNAYLFGNSAWFYS